MSEQNWKLLFGIFELWKLSYNGILVNTRIFGTHDQREVMSLFFFFSPPYFFSPFFCTDSLNSFFFFFLFSFFFLFLSFFLLHRLTLTAIFFLLLHSFSFFSSSQKHMGNFIKKKKTRGYQFLKPINTWYWSYIQCFHIPHLGFSFQSGCLRSKWFFQLGV